MCWARVCVMRSMPFLESVHHNSPNRISRTISRDLRGLQSPEIASPEVRTHQISRDLRGLLSPEIASPEVIASGDCISDSPELIKSPAISGDFEI